MLTKHLSENLKERDHSENLGADGRIISEWILRECEKLWTGFIGLRIGGSDGIL
jgi:hypothetical protein